GITVLLRRLANPHLPPDQFPSNKDGTPNPWYNPYLTVDYLDRVPVRVRDVTDPKAPRYASRGKRQPYAADFSQIQDQIAEGLMTQVTQHTFGRPNNPLPTSGHYDWL